MLMGVWCNNIGLVSLIFLGRELCRNCLILSPHFLGQPYIPFSKFKNFWFTCPPTHFVTWDFIIHTTNGTTLYTQYYLLCDYVTCSYYVTYQRLFVVVSKCKLFTCGYIVYRMMCSHQGIEAFMSTIVLAMFRKTVCCCLQDQCLHFRQCIYLVSGCKTLSIHQS